MLITLPALLIDAGKCKGKLACMRVCPTCAIRVRSCKVAINPTLCIDCGECIVACPEGAIHARIDQWEDAQKYKFKVAIVTPTLFGQFPRSITPYDIVNGLLAIGFDAVHDLSLESELYSRAVRDYLDDYTGPLPLISSICPVVVRLIQVSYPDMVGQITPFQPPREIGGREVKRIYSEKLGIPESDIGAIYIAPCPAKAASIKYPAEGAKSHLDMAIGINDIYNPLLAAITKLKKINKDETKILPDNELNSALYINLSITGGLSRALKQNKYITVSQLPNITKVFEDIEKGKIRSIDFLECFACTSGCIGGPLTVDDRFVARSKLQKLIEIMEREGRTIDEEVEKRYVKGDYFLEQPLKPRPIEASTISIIEQIEIMKTREEFGEHLPGIDCGLCGSPTCAAFAEDIANRTAEPSDCIFFSTDRLDVLKHLYHLKNDKEDK